MNQSFKIEVNKCCGNTLIARLAEKGITAIKNGTEWTCVVTQRRLQMITCLNMTPVAYHKMFAWKFMCAEGIIKGITSSGQKRWL